MTGYGLAQAGLSIGQVIVEVKSLNNKGLDLSIRLPKILSEKEFIIRNKLQLAVERGKCHFSIVIDNASQATGLPKFNHTAVSHYLEELKIINTEFNLRLETNFQTLCNLPDVLQTADEISETDWNAIEQLITKALEAFDTFRETEGKETAKMLANAVKEIKLSLEQIIELDINRTQLMRDRLRKQVIEQQLQQGIDENRFEQELIYYIEKLDISEEKQRLNQHINYFEQTLLQGGGVGKKLGFIAQELGREINTIGSKAQHFEIQQQVVLMKDALEKIKEQLLNLM